MSYKNLYEQFEKESYNLKVEDYEGRITVTRYDVPITYMSDEEKEARKNDKMDSESRKRTAKDNQPDFGDHIPDTWYHPKTGEVEITIPEGCAYFVDDFSRMEFIVYPKLTEPLPDEKLLTWHIVDRMDESVKKSYRLPKGFTVWENPFTGELNLVPLPKYMPRDHAFRTNRELIEYAKMMIEDEEDAKKLSERLRNVRRTKQNIYELTKANKWELFVTLTISPAVIYKGKQVRYDLALAKEYIGKRINKLRERKGLNFGYVLIPEEHEDGAWHFHGLLKDTVGLKLREAINPYTLKQIITKGGDFRLQSA